MTMPQSAVTIPVSTHSHSELISVTAEIKARIPAGFNGVCVLFCQHTTAGLTINENADPDVTRDVLAELERLVPWDNPRFRHSEGNSAAHVKASLMGPSLTVPVADGRLTLGTWQDVYFCEFDGPRSRRIVMRLIAG
jgi:secondary thiamine-phosphate synthase enzyme